MLEQERLDSILANRSLTALFQPIVSCATGELLGHEALIRGPSSGPLHSPLKLFDAAAHAGRRVELDLLCRAVAIRAFSKADCPGRLFLNINPEAVVASEHPTGETLRVLEQAALAPERIVIEIAEQLPIRDYDIVRHALDHYRASGFAVALDDLGAGNAGLRQWSELRPDYVKIDRYFASGLEDDITKREVVRSVIEMSQRMGTRVIVEGIETEVEYTTLRSLGMTHAQGYLLGRPAPRPLNTDPPMPGDAPASGLGETASRPKADAIAQSVLPEAATATATRVLQRLEKEPGLGAIPLVDDDGRPLGVIRRNALLSRLSHRYGYALLAHKQAIAFLDSTTVTVPRDLPLEALSRRMTDRAESDEEFLITDTAGRYMAMGSVYDLLRRITDLQIQNARHANPLTGLPGNVLIEQHIDGLLAADAAFTVVHADLDHFKAYNDFYGYQRGDEVILATARLLQAHQHTDEFAGHVGGDDFVLVLSARDWQTRCEALLSTFASRVPEFYDAADRDRGWIETVDRRGKMECVPLLSISLSVVPVGPSRFSSHNAIAATMAEIKRCAKQQAGNSLFVDCRSHCAEQPPCSEQYAEAISTAAAR